MMHAWHCLISGRVQGVGYRNGLQHAAKRLGVTGWVRNLQNGQVEAWMEGEPAQLSALLSWARRGPPQAEVTDIEQHAVDAQGLRGFVRRETV